MVKTGFVRPAVAKNVSVSNLDRTKSVDLKSSIFTKLCSLDGNSEDLTSMDISKASTLKGKYGIKDVVVNNNETTISCDNGDKFVLKVRSYTNEEKFNWLTEATKDNDCYEITRDGNSVKIKFKKSVKAGNVRRYFNITEGAITAHNTTESAVRHGTTSIDSKHVPYAADDRTKDYDAVEFEAGESIIIPLDDINPTNMNKYYKEDPARQQELDSYNKGVQFAYDAIGYTTENDHKNMKSALADLKATGTPGQAVAFIAGYYQEIESSTHSGFFEQIGHENDSSKITNGEACMLMRKIMDAIPEEKKYSDDYGTLYKIYNEYNSKPADELFGDSTYSWFSRMFGQNTLDQLDDAIEDLLGL